jgi:hypothetical protein
MGRTLPTVNQVLEQNREQWSRFYRALRKEDRELLDRLFDGAKYFTAACVYQAHVTPSESITLAMLLHLEKELEALKSRLGEETTTLGQGFLLPERTSQTMVGENSAAMKLLAEKSGLKPDDL